MSFKPHCILTLNRVPSVTAGLREVPLMTSNMSSSFTARGTEVEWHTAGTFRELRVYVDQNTANGPCTVTTQINGVVGNLTCTIPAATTGIFSDLTNEDTTIPTDLNCFVLSRGGTTGAFRPERISCNFYTDGKVVNKIGNCINTVYTFSNATRYQPIGQWLNATYSSPQTDSPSMKSNLSNLVWKNFSIDVLSNSRTNPMTFQFRKNLTTNGNMSIIVPAFTTGLFSDLINTDTGVTQPAYQYVSGSGTQNITFNTSIECESNPYHWTAFNLDINGTGGGGFNFIGTRYIQAFCRATSAFLTENNDVEVTMDCDGVISGLSTYWTTNTKTGNSELVLRKNKTDTALAVTILSGVTNSFFENTTDLVYFKKGDTINFKIVTTSAGSLLNRWITLSILQNSGKPATITVL